MQPRPDIVLATGDLTERGSPHEYRRLRSILGRLEIPHFLIPGNHDDRESLRRAFRDHRYLRTFASHASFAIEAWPLRIIGLDSTTPGRGGGFVDDERLAWLDANCVRTPAGQRSLRCIIRPFAPACRGWMPTVLRTPTASARRAGASADRADHRRPSAHGPDPAMEGAVACTAPSTSPQFVLGRSRLGTGSNPPGFCYTNGASMPTCTPSSSASTAASNSR